MTASFVWRLGLRGPEPELWFGTVIVPFSTPRHGVIPIERANVGDVVARHELSRDEPIALAELSEKYPAPTKPETQP